MSRENVEVVLRSFDVWNEGDVDAIRGLYTEDAVIQTPGWGLTKLGETFEGDDPIGRWVAQIREAWAKVRFESERIFEGDDLVVSSYRVVPVGRRSGAEVVGTRAAVYRIRDGKIASEHVYLDLDEALEAAGLRE